MANTNVITSQVDPRAADMGSSLGRGASSALEEKLQHLANIKAEKIRAGHLKQLMPHATDKDLQTLAHLGTDYEKSAILNKFGMTPNQGPSNIGTFQPPQVNIPSGVGALQNTSGQQQITAAPSMPQGIQPIDYMNALGAVGLKMGPQQQKQFESLSPENQLKVAEQVYDNMPEKYQKRMQDLLDKQALDQVGKGQQRQQALQPSQVPQQIIGSEQPGVAPAQQPASLGEAVSQGLRGQTRGTERLAFEKEREKRISDQYAHKTNKEFVHNILDREKAKNEEDAILKRIIKISEKEDSNVRNPVLSGIMRDIGIDYQGLKNGDTLELDKLARWFLRGGTKLFGGRVSNAEMYAILDQVPNALQTKEGRIRLAKQMILANKDYHDEARMLKQIIRENGGKYPLDLEIKLSERMEELNAQNAYNFINSIYEGNIPDMVGKFKVGQKLPSSDISKLPDGTIYKKNGKRYQIKDGKEMEL